MGRGARFWLAAIVVAAVSVASAASAASAPASASARPLADCQPFQARPCAFPFPSDLFTVPDPVTDTGLRVRLPAAALPVSNDGVGLRVGPYDDSDGFSPGSTLIVHVPGLDNQQALQQTGAAGLQDIGASTSPGQPIVVLDEQTGERVPIWSELDPVGAPPASTDLVIHPAGSFTEGHTYLVALRSLRTAAGGLIGAPRWFDRLRAGRPSRAEAGQLPLYRYLFRLLARAGIHRNHLYETWQFTVASSESLTERLLAMRDSAFAELGDRDLGTGGAVGNAPGFQVLSTTPLAAGVQEVSGTLQVPCYLKTCGLSSATGFHYSSHAFYAPPTQIPGQFVTAPFECIVPPSASPSSPARISLYGHGFLSTGVDVTEPSQQQLALRQQHRPLLDRLVGSGHRGQVERHPRDAESQPVAGAGGADAAGGARHGLPGTADDQPRRPGWQRRLPARRSVGARQLAAVLRRQQHRRDPGRDRDR